MTTTVTKTRKTPKRRRLLVGHAMDLTEENARTIGPYEFAFAFDRLNIQRQRDGKDPYTLRSFAADCGVSSSTVSNVFNGNHAISPAVPTLLRIGGALGYSLQVRRKR